MSRNMQDNAKQKLLDEKVDQLLKMAEETTHRILRTSLQMRESEMAEKRKQSAIKKGKVSGKADPRGSKRRHVSSNSSHEDNDERLSSGEINFVGQPKCLSEGCVLHPHQMDSLKWTASLYENGVNGILADDMGMGKTIQAIAMLAYLHETVGIRNKPHLIVAPKSTIGNWMKEFKKWAPFFRVVNLNPKMEYRREILANEMKKGYFDVCVTTYEAILICEADRVCDLRKYNFHYVIFDEAHKLKNSESKIAAASRRIPSYRRLLLTGTPLQNNIGELWSLLNFLMPSLFTSRDDFAEWFDFSNYENQTGGQDQQDQKMVMVKKLHQILRPFLLRRTKSDLATKLPDKIEININVKLSQLQVDLYCQFLTQVGGYSALVSNIGSSKSLNLKNYHNIMMQLRKVCNHPYLFDGVEPEGADEFGEHLVEASGKLLLIDKLLKKVLPQKEQVLIFSCFTMTLNIIEDFCAMRGIVYHRLDGNTELEEREEAITEFTRPGSDSQVFLISTRAGGLGINLMTANHVVIFDSDWNPQVDLQAMDRAHRIGQKKKVYVYRLISQDTVEEKIIERQAIKLKLDQVIIQQGHQATNKNLSKEEYEKILLHGAASIMKQKNAKISGVDIDIEQLIKEGEEKHLALKKAAESQVDQMKQETNFDFSLESIDCFKFQEKDFREEKKRVQALLHEQLAEQAKKAAELNQGRNMGRNKRLVTMMDNDEVHAFHDKARLRADRAEARGGEFDYKPPKKDKSIIAQKCFEFQFYPDFDKVQALSLKIAKLQDNFEIIPDQVKDEYNEQIEQGFSDWSQRDYVQFIKAFRRRPIDDVDGIASEIDSKTAEQVQHYLNVFLTRFRETKERDIVLRKFQHRDFDQKNLETILHFDDYKDYAILLQENHYFGRTEYVNMIQKEHERLKLQNGITEVEEQKSGAPSSKLSLRLDHFYHSQPKKLVQEQLKYIATAIRAEKTLRDHMYHMNQHQKEMKTMMDRSKLFSKGYQEGLTKRDQDMMQKDFEQQKEIDKQENKKKVSQVSSSNKFGKNKPNIAKLFEK